MMSPPSVQSPGKSRTLPFRRWPRPAIALMPFILAFGVYLLIFLSMRTATPTGDEPHYLLYADAIAHGTFDLRGVYAHDVSRFFPAPTIQPHAYVYRTDGALRGQHPPGLPLLLAPIVRLGAGANKARMFMIVLSAWLAQELFGLLREATPARRTVLWSAWAVTALLLPLLIYSSQIYPDGPAALIIVATTRRLLRRRTTVFDGLIVVIGPALLPWLHPRFLAFAVGLTAWAVLRGFRVLAPLALGVSIMLLGGCFWYWYGSPDPRQAYAPSGGQHWSLAAFYQHSVGLIFSPDFGWLPFAPVQLVGVAGTGLLLRRYGPGVLAGLAVIGLYLVTLGTENATIGYSYPGRYAVAFVPLIALPLAFALTRRRYLWALFVPLAVLSLAISARGVRRWFDLYAAGQKTTIPIARSLAPLWPRTDMPAGQDFPHWPLATIWIAALTGTALAVSLPRRPGRRISSGDESATTASVSAGS